MKLKAPFFIRFGLLLIGVLFALLIPETVPFTSERLFVMLVSFGCIWMYVWESGRFIEVK